MKLLVVDDCVRHAQSLAELLRMRDYADVTAISEPGQVTALHAAHDYDLIVLDLCMPEVDGLAVMERLQAASESKLLPILVVTGYSSRKNEALAAGALDVIIKPYDMGELDLRIRNALRVRMLVRDLSLRAEEHRVMALHDALTGLPNRRLLLDRIDTALQLAKRNGRHTALLYIDLDGFKKVNDQLGHAAGDDVLQHVAKRLSHSVRQADTVGRLGGDEFVMVLSEVRSPQEAAVPAEKIIHALSSPFAVGERQVQISASVGIAVYPEQGSTASELLAHADAALYAIKVAGKNGYRFASEIAADRKA